MWGGLDADNNHVISEWISWGGFVEQMKDRFGNDMLDRQTTLKLTFYNAGERKTIYFEV